MRKDNYVSLLFCTPILLFRGFVLIVLWFEISGTRFQAARNKDEEENVASEYEDKIDCVGHHHCTNSHYYPVCLPWLQVLISIDMKPLYPPFHIRMVLYRVLISITACVNIVAYVVHIGFGVSCYMRIFFFNFTSLEKWNACDFICLLCIRVFSMCSFSLTWICVICWSYSARVVSFAVKNMHNKEKILKRNEKWFKSITRQNIWPSHELNQSSSVRYKYHFSSKNDTKKACLEGIWIVVAK